MAFEKRLELLIFRLLINGTGSLTNLISFDIVALGEMPKEV